MIIIYHSYINSLLMINIVLFDQKNWITTHPPDDDHQKGVHGCPWVSSGPMEVSKNLEDGGNLLDI